MNGNDKKSFQRILLPIIRRVMPTITANEVMNGHAMLSTPFIVGEHVVAFNGTDYHYVKLSLDYQNGLPSNKEYAWCTEVFGKSDADSPRRWFKMGISYYFKEEIDRTAFVMRWS